MTYDFEKMATPYKSEEDKTEQKYSCQKNECSICIEKFCEAGSANKNKEFQTPS